MALIKYGGGIVGMSGSIAGQTHARNRFGNYMRSRTKPVNPNSDRQVASRARMMQLAEQWRESPMTDAKRAAWQTYAESVNWTNKLGESVTLTGFNMFMRSNAVRLVCGETFVEDGPVDLGLPGADPLFAIAASAANGITITYDDGLDFNDEDEAHLLMDTGQPQNPTRNFFNGPWRHDFNIDGSVGVPPSSPFGPYASNSWTLVEGQRIWARGAIIRADGRVSSKFYAPNVLIGA